MILYRLVIRFDRSEICLTVFWHNSDEGDIGTFFYQKQINVLNKNKKHENDEKSSS